jgi:hypothetical protein
MDECPSPDNPTEWGILPQIDKKDSKSAEYSHMAHEMNM